MKLATFGIETAAKLIFDQHLWSAAKRLVQEQTDSSLSGEEKRAAVKKDLKIILGDVAEVLLNAAIELGVMWVKSQAPDVQLPEVNS